MAVITRITQQKRDLERFNIFLDGKYAFSVHETVFVKYGLTKGMTLEDWTLDEVIYEDQISKAFNRALHYLGFRMRSEFEVKEKLLELEYGEAVVLEAIVKLRRLGFLDDKNFAEALMETRIRTSKRGPRKIQEELKQKGIKKELLEEVLESYSEESQITIARELAEKEASKNRALSPRQTEQRIQNLLQRQGYSFSIIKEALADIDFGIGEDEWKEVTNSIGEKAWRRNQSKYSGRDLHNRVKKAMYDKGIPFERIDQFIEMKENEDDN